MNSKKGVPEVIARLKPLNHEGFCKAAAEILNIEADCKGLVMANVGMVVDMHNQQVFKYAIQWEAAQGQEWAPCSSPRSAKSIPTE